MKVNLPLVVAAAFVLAACATPSDDGADSGSGGKTAVTSSSSASSSSAPVTAKTIAPASTSAPESSPTGAKPGSQLDLEITIGDRVFFGYDKSTLSSSARNQIERWGAWLITYPQNKLIIEGHADERGTREYNLALGERRANAAREYLISLGIDPNRVKTISFGKERPAIPGSNKNAYEQNRRAVAVLDTK